MKKSLLKISTMLLAVLLVSPFTSNTKAFASEMDKATTEGTIEITDSDFDTMLETGEAVYLGDSTWAKIETYDEMVNNISESKNLTKEEVIEQMGDNQENKIESSLITSRMATMNANSLIETRSATESYYYVHFYKQFQAGNSGWYPQIDIYAKCTGINRSFVGIQDLNLIPSYNYISKSFQGKCQAMVENSKTIYWVVNGDFYDHGTTSYNFGGTVNIGKFATVNCSITGANNHFAYAYATGYVKNR